MQKFKNRSLVTVYGMPFTPLHLGPALALGLPLRKYLHVPTFILGNVVLDLEPFIVIIFGLNYPLHGYLHTILLALVGGGVLGFVMFKIEKPLQSFYKTVQLEAQTPLKFRSFLFAGVSGAILHVLFDSLLYLEIQPFFPLTINPLLEVSISTSNVYILCVYLGAFGGLYYVGLLAYWFFKKNR